jgi:broad specificity phosphatase PhoE
VTVPRLLLFLTLALAGAPARAADAVLYVVRHAEKAAEPKDDPALSETGTARAQGLAKLLADVEIVGVHSTSYARTRLTAAPTASARHLEVSPYATEAEVVARARAAGGSHLVVGHSNTIAAIVAAAGGDPGPPVGDAEFDRLYVVVVPDSGKPTTVRLRTSP